MLPYLSYKFLHPLEYGKRHEYCYEYFWKNYVKHVGISVTCNEDITYTEIYIYLPTNGRMKDLVELCEKYGGSKWMMEAS